jgi:hypothetical protein
MNYNEVVVNTFGFKNKKEEKLSRRMKAVGWPISKEADGSWRIMIRDASEEVRWYQKQWYRYNAVKNLYEKVPLSQILRLLSEAELRD